jgi:hypothetical protein
VNAGSEARGLTELVAAHRQRPTIPRIEKFGLTSATHYVYCYAGGSNGEAFANMHAEKGYPGSSLDHHYMADPKTRNGCAAADAHRGFVLHANRPCPCDQCLQGNQPECTVKRLFDNAVGRSEIERRSGIVARAATRSRVTAAWTETIVEGTIVAVRVHNEEPNEHGEQYYLAVVSRDDVGPDAPADDDNDVQKLV